MKVSRDWLSQLVDLKIPIEEVIKLLPLRTIGTKEVTTDFFELDMKGYNRADLLSVRGVAYEVVAITGSKIKFREPAESEYFWVTKSLPKVSVKVEDENLCPLYTVAKIEDLPVGPSPREWVKKLADSGVRSINNVADVTNLIMLEYGQPLHAFDGAQVKDETIIVRTALPSETLQTLDGKTRKLEKNDLLITDPEKILGLAGVMGGKDSEVSNKTTTILLEAAIFDGKNLRKTAQRLGLQSEASKRFQHGLTRKRLFQALNAAIKMYQELGGKITALTIKGEDQEISKKIPLTLEKVIRLIGVDIGPKEVEKYLTPLGFKLDLQLNPKSLIAWVVTPPYYRLDIEIEEDVIEEIARMYGYEKIPSKPLEGEPPTKTDQSLFDFIYNLKDSLVEAGLTEVQTYSFFSTKVLGALGFNETNQDAIIKIANPISAETEYLREFIWPNLVEVVEKNLKQGFSDIAIFEIGKVYLPQAGNLPKESYRLAMALINGSDNPVEELISTVKSLFGHSGAERSEAIESNNKDSTSAKPKQALLISRTASSFQNDIIIEKGGLMKELETLFHPTRFATVKVDNKVIGGLAEVHPRFLSHFGIEKRVAIMEVSIDPLV